MYWPQTLVSSSILLLLLLVLLQNPHSCRAAADLKACGFTAIYCFGDSLYDVGNVVVEFPGTFTSIPPNGMTIGKPTGRNSDGYLIIDRIAEAAGLPHLNPSLEKNADHSKGAVFAVGGTGLLSKEERKKWNVVLPYSNSSLDVQLRWFEQLVTQTYPDETVRQEHMKTSLFSLGGGSADYRNLKTSVQAPLLEQKKLIMPLSMAALKNAIKTIMSYGGRTFLINGVYQGGCLPGGEEDNGVHCDEPEQEYHEYHNTILKRSIAQWAQEFPDARIVYGDIWGANQWVFDHAEAEGIKYVNKACCDGPCGKPGVTNCKNPNEYMFWDGGHLTDHSYKLMSDVLIPQVAQELHCGA